MAHCFRKIRALDKRGLLRCHFPNFRETKRKEGKRRNATSAAALSSQTEIDPLAAAAAAQLGNGSEGTQSQKRKIYGRRQTHSTKSIFSDFHALQAAGSLVAVLTNEFKCLVCCVYLRFWSWHHDTKLKRK